MFKLKINEKILTIPKSNLRFLAISKAIDLNLNVKLDTVEDAIKFLNKLGIEVFE